MKTTVVDQSICQKGLHILALFAIAVAHPVLDLTARNPAFFVARNSQPSELLLLVATLCLLFPGFLILIQWSIGHRTLPGRTIHAITLFVLSSAIFMPALNQATDAGSEWIFPLTIFSAALITFVYFHFEGARSAITLLSPVLIIVPVLFFTDSRINRIVWPSQKRIEPASIQSKHPVVMVVFDELPLKSLLDEKGNIDSRRYPNFAELARTSLWYRNATTVSSETIHAIPAILTGNYPADDLLPNRIDYPRNILSMVEREYRLQVYEFITGFSSTPGTEQTAPVSGKMLLLFTDLSAIYLHHLMPSDQTGRLPVITQTWGHFWEQQRFTQSNSPATLTSTDQRARHFRKFVQSINRNNRPGFYFVHTMLPHVPWQYFPSGTQYNPHGIGYFGVDGLTRHEIWIKDSTSIELSLKRHLLQVGFVDHLLGELMGKLKQEGLWDESVLIILSDHGASFREGRRRGITKQNFQDILQIPLFIKMPFQTTGDVSDTNAQIIDVMPTLQSVLKIDSNWKVDGRSLVTNSPEPKWKTMFHRRQKYHFPARSEFIAWFSRSGPETTGNTVHQDWIGKSLNDFKYTGESPIEVRLHNSNAFSRVDLQSGFIPALITADLQPVQADSEIAFGIVVNNVLRATTRPFQFGTQMQFLSSVVPESSFQSGRNDVEIILIPQTNKKQFQRPHLIRENGQPLLDYSGKDKRPISVK